MQRRKHLASSIYNASPRRFAFRLPIDVKICEDRIIQSDRVGNFLTPKSLWATFSSSSVNSSSRQHWRSLSGWTRRRRKRCCLWPRARSKFMSRTCTFLNTYPTLLDMPSCGPCFVWCVPPIAKAAFERSRTEQWGLLPQVWPVCTLHPQSPLKTRQRPTDTVSRSSVEIYCRWTVNMCHVERRETVRINE